MGQALIQQPHTAKQICEALGHYPQLKAKKKVEERSAGREVLTIYYAVVHCERCLKELSKEEIHSC